MSSDLTSPVWAVLLVDDDEEDALLVREWLAQAVVSRFHFQWEKTCSSGLEALSHQAFDLVLVDYRLGDCSGLSLIGSIHERRPELPIIVLTGQDNYLIDLEAMQIGAIDYLTKNDVTPRLLERAIRYAIHQKQAEVSLKQARDSLEQKVQARTKKLEQQKKALEAEIEARQHVENELAEVRRQLIDQAELNRVELAKEIHDGVMQDLYALIYQFETTRKDGDPAQAMEALAASIPEIIRVTQDLRVITGELRPPNLIHLGLEKAIRSHASKLLGQNPHIGLKIQIQPEIILPEMVSLTLYRIYQVAITNVIRHANATQISIRLLKDTGHLTMEVEDNGIGFNTPKSWLQFIQEGHFGLASAAERASAIGGFLDIRSHLESGSVVRVTVPI